MTSAVATSAPVLPGEVRLQLELRWRDTVVTSKGFDFHVLAGPTRRFMFPLEGLDCDADGYGLALRDGDTFLITPPPGLQPQRPIRLSEGMRTEFCNGELSLRAWVTREPQAGSLDWLWLFGGALALLTLYQLVKYFGVVFAVLLLLLPHPKPSRFTQQRLAAKTVEPKRLVKVRPFLPEVKPPPLPEKSTERLKLLMAGKRSEEIFKDAGKKKAERERHDEGKAARVALLKAFSGTGELKMIGVLGSLSAPHEADLLMGGAIGSVQGDVFGAGGLGLKGTGEGGGGRGEGIGLGSIGTIGHGAGTGTGDGYGSGMGRLGGSHTGASAAEQEARSLARRAGEDCFGHEEGRVLMRVQFDADGKASGTALTKAAPPAVVECLKEKVRQWLLPASPEGGRLTVVFRGG